MNKFQTIESGKGLLKDNYLIPADQMNSKTPISDWLKERKRKKPEEGRYYEAK